MQLTHLLDWLRSNSVLRQHRHHNRRSTFPDHTRLVGCEQLEQKALLSADSFTASSLGAYGPFTVQHEDGELDRLPEWESRFGGAYEFRSAASDRHHVTDVFVPVQSGLAYGISGWAKSGDEFGLRFDPNNQQSFGIEAYNADYQLLGTFPAALDQQAISADFTFQQHTAVVGFGAEYPTQLPVDTSFVRPYVDINQHASTSNFVTWRDIVVRELPAGSTADAMDLPLVDLSVDTPDSEVAELSSVALTDPYRFASTDKRIVVDTNLNYGLAVNMFELEDEFHHFVGIRSYDSDGLLIHSVHVTRFEDATDTLLTKAVNPGDTSIFVADARGWSNDFGASAETRSLAWYGYANSSGDVYDDYSYTRNVAFDFDNGVWSSEGINFDAAENAWRIDLVNPWAGPAINAGIAIRNASGSDSVQTFTTPTGGFYFDTPDGHRDERDWVTLRPEIGNGTWQNGQPDENTFRPGTASVQPVLRNWIGDANIRFGVSHDLDGELADLQASFDGSNRVVLDASLQVAVADQRTPVDTGSNYVLQARVAAGLTFSGAATSSEQHSLGYYPYDSDGLAIESQHVTRFWSATDTTLAADLNLGDTTIELTDGHGWSNGGLPETRAFAWFGYQSSGGQLFDDFTYTRNVAFDQINGLWDAGSVNGNTITLRSPWTGPVLASGSSVRNATGGDSLIPAVAEDQSVPNAWRTFVQGVGGEWQDGVRSNSAFPPGTSAVQLAVQANRSEFADDDVLQVRDFSLTKFHGPLISANSDRQLITDLDVLANDKVENRNVEIVSVTDGSYGTAIVVTDGGANGQDIVRYTSAAWFAGTDVVSYVARDLDSGEEWTATVAVTVLGSNLASDAATASQIASQGQDATANTSAPSPTRNGTLYQSTLHQIESGQSLQADSMPVEALNFLAEDGDSDTLAFEITSGVSNGVLNFNFDGTFEYTPNDGFVGADGFDYVVSDGLHTTRLRANILVNASDDELLETRMGEIILGLHNFHDVYSRFPYDPAQSDRYDANGVPHLSWRVHMLPFLGYQNLYAQFRFDEPWNSAHNLPLASQMPQQFRSPGDSGDTNTTRFQIVSNFDDLSGKYLIGQGSDGNLQMGRIRDMTDGFQNTVMFVESGPDVAVPWTAPVDIDFDPANPFAAWGTVPNGQLQLMIADGSVISIDLSTVSGSELDSLITKQGDEPIDADTIERRDIQQTTGPRLHNPEQASQYVNQFRELGLAFHNFHDVFNRFPVSNAPDHFDAAGKPHHSWRVHLLPYLGHSNIYEQFRLDEPWDSAHNLPLISLMPDVYRSLGDAWDSTTTRIQTFTGPDAPFPDPNASSDYFSPRFRDFTDGSSNTIMFTEVGADRSVPWTAPQDILFDVNNPMEGLGDLSDGTIRLGMADGAYRETGIDINPDWFAALVTHQGREVDEDGFSLFRELQRTTNVVPQLTFTRNGLKQIGLGLHNYHDVFNRFPIGTSNPSHFDADGRPLLSWRVHLLPFIEQNSLYQQFNLDEPWDSPNNLPLLDKMPKLFRSVSDPFDSTTTKFQVLRGEHATFRDPSPGSMERGPRFRDITDGTSNTILVVEAGDSAAVPWTQPSDIEFDPTDVLGSLGLPEDALLHAVMFDGSVQNFRLDYSDAWISSWISRDGGEVSQGLAGSTTPGFSVNKSELVVAEGELGAIEVTLTKPGNVQFDVTLSRNGVVAADKVSLTFTTANWDTPQAVTLEAIDDLFPDNGESLTVSIAVNAANSDDEFDSLPTKSVLVTTVDDDAPAFSVLGTQTDTTVTEGGDSDTFSVTLLAQPASNVVFTVDIADRQNATIDSSTLTFTPTNWNAPQTVTVAAIDDPFVEGDQTTVVVVAIDPDNSDDSYDNLPPQALPVTIIDNEVAGFSVTQSNGATSVSESGTADRVTVVLTAQPVGNVVIQTHNPNPAELTIATNSMTFTPDNWNIRQPIVVLGVDDFSPDGDQTTDLTISVDTSQSHPTFHQVQPQSLIVTTIDDEPGRLDIDGNNTPNATTDGILAIRHMFGFTGQALIGDAIGTGATNTTSSLVISALLAAPEMLDADGNGTQDATTDGILIIRYLLGFTDEALVSNAIGSGAIRTTGPEVIEFLNGFMPRSNGSGAGGSTAGSLAGGNGNDGLPEEPAGGESPRSSETLVTPNNNAAPNNGRKAGLFDNQPSGFNQTPQLSFQGLAAGWPLDLPKPARSTTTPNPRSGKSWITQTRLNASSDDGLNVQLSAVEKSPLLDDDTMIKLQPFDVGLETPTAQAAQAPDAEETIPSSVAAEASETGVENAESEQLITNWWGTNDWQPESAVFARPKAISQ